MIRLTLIDNYVYTEHPIECDYTIVYAPHAIHYTTTLDTDIQDTQAIAHHVVDNYRAMVRDPDTEYILLVEEVVDNTTLEGAILHLKEAAKAACLTAIQESTLIDKVTQWVAERQPTLMRHLSTGQVRRNVVPYPYAAHDASMLVYVDSTRRHTLTNTQMCGIPIVLALPYTQREQHTQHSYATKHTLSAEEAVRAIQQLQAAYNYGATTQQVTDILHRLNTAVYTDSMWGNGTVEVVKDQGLQQHKDTQPQAEGTATYTVCSIPTVEDKPVCLAYEGKDTDTQLHSDTHTHIQQEDTTHVYSVEDTHYYTQVDSVVDTHTLTHNDVVYDTQEIDTYIHTAVDTTTLY